MVDPLLTDAIKKAVREAEERVWKLAADAVCEGCRVNDPIRKGEECWHYDGTAASHGWKAALPRLQMSRLRHPRRAREGEEMKEPKPVLEDILPVEISLKTPCKGCRLGFDREEDGGQFWHVWEGRAYPCTEDPSHADAREKEGKS